MWSCHALLEPDADLELTFGALNWASVDPVDAGTRRVISNGFNIIIDKDDRFEILLQAIMNSA